MSNIPDAQLNDNEKVIIMRSIFNVGNKNKDKYVKNIGDFISSNFEKIDNFDFRWTSLITNNPLLFEDVNYLRVKPFVDNQITEEERQAYIRGDLSEIYNTFDNMLMCNLSSYDRIINFCTMIFLHYVEIGEQNVNKDLAKIPFELSMTPTRLYCCVFSNVNSSLWELNYAWGTKIQKSTLSQKSILEHNWYKFYKIKMFAKFMEYSALRCGTIGFRQTYMADKTTNRKLAQICSKFTKTSVAITEEQLETLYEYSKESDIINKRLYTSIDNCLSILFNGDVTQYAIYIFSKEFYIHSSKFSIRVRSENGIISKDYLANSYECFIAEEFLLASIKTQIEWAKYKIPISFEYDKSILKNLLHNMLEENYKDILCIKRMNEYGIISKVWFSGIFANVKINEDFIIDNRVIRHQEKVLSKKNAANYLIERGYFIFGISKDIFGLESLNKNSIISHYKNYCIPVMQHMQDVINANILSKNDIIDVVVSGKLNPNKLNNENILYASTINTDPKKLFSSGLEKQNKRLNHGTRKKSYWTAIED